MNTTYFLDAIMGNVFQSKTSPALPESYYIGLSSTAPAVDGTGVTEPAGGAYARVELTGLTQPDNGEIENGATVTFAESTADWGTMTHYVVFDAATGGNLLFYSALTHQRVVDVDTIVAFKPGELTITLQNV